MKDLPLNYRINYRLINSSEVESLVSLKTNARSKTSEPLLQSILDNYINLDDKTKRFYLKRSIIEAMTNAKINEAVSKSAADFLLMPDEAYKLTFEKLVIVQGNNKYARASFDIGHKQFMEIIDKYGLKPSKKWQVYDASLKRNVPYQEQ